MLRDIYSELEFVHLPGREVLFQQGDPGDALYVLIGGRVRVSTEGPTQSKTNIAELGVGEVIGEMALIGGQKRTATVTAVRDSELARLSRGAFDRLVECHPLAILRSFGSAAIARVREQMSGHVFSSTLPKTLALIPAEPAVELNDFCARMEKCLAEYVKATVVSRHTIETHFGKEGSESCKADEVHARFVSWFDECETLNDLVMYQADPTHSWWTTQVLRQADHILVVGNGAVAPVTPHAAFTAAVQNGVRFTIVLLHENGTIPSGTRAWLDAYRADQVHHVHKASSRDYARLARFLTGRAIGVVLGGGFARGMAHIGILRALDECGVPVDLLGGTSIGAVIAVQRALGSNYDDLLRTTYAGFKSCFKDVTLPFVSVLSGHNFSCYVKSSLGGIDIEDLEIPFFCVSANLSRAQVYIHKRGAVVPSILATTRVPGIFPPIVQNGDLLVDGGIADNLPVKFMKSFANGGRVVASDVSARVECANWTDYGYAVSGWKHLLHSLKRFRPASHAPTLSYVLMRTVEFGSADDREHASDLADLYLRAPLKDFKANDLKHGRRMAEIAYNYAKPRIEEWISNNPVARHSR